MPGRSYGIQEGRAAAVSRTSRRRHTSGRQALHAVEFAGAPKTQDRDGLRRLQFAVCRLP